jgi:hypothetical protein
MLGALTRAFGATGSQLSGVTGGNGLNVTDRVDPNWKHAATRFAKLPNQVKQSEVIKATEYASKLEANVKQRGRLMKEHHKAVNACIEAHAQNIQHAEFMTKSRVRVHQMDAKHQIKLHEAMTDLGQQQAELSAYDRIHDRSRSLINF